ncbi:cupredoxin-domain containing protein [Bdellovibrio sp. qaytius]|nr:cupredoxin-domain containing protein [Bdellovibrio sp. qaytius]
MLGTIMLTALLLLSNLAFADDLVFKIELKNRTMVPSEIIVAPNTAFTIEVVNTDNTAEEFESKSLKIEKIIPPKRTSKFNVKPLAAGEYDLFGEFHMDTCQGKIIVK